MTELGTKSVFVLHTGPVTVEPLKARFRLLLPDVRVINLVDDSLLNDALSAGHVTKAIKKRIFQYMKIGEDMGVDVILNACSSVGEVVDDVRPFISTPILKIDEPMARRAIEMGNRIGVVATVPTTLDPTVRLIESKAREIGKAIQIERTLCPGAFDKLLQGDADEHDSIVIGSVKEISRRVDVVVLAQVSMARLMPKLEGIGTPVLSSPDLGVAAVKDVLMRAEGK